MVERALKVAGGKAYILAKTLSFNFFQKRTNRSMQCFLEPVNFELRLAVRNFLLSFSLICS